MINKKLFLIPTLIATGCFAKGKVEKPNVIIIFTDDQGYADLGCQGSQDIKTPNIDKLASQGVRLTSGYVTAPQCMPSRAGILSGTYQQHYGFYDNNSGPLPLNVPTLGNYMQNAGYVTGQVGKWHHQVGVKKANNKFGFIHYHGGEEMLPGARGFDEYFVRANIDFNEQLYFANYDLDNKPRSNPFDALETKLYRVDAQTEAALGFIRRNAESEKPFFLYLAYYAPHVPLVASQKYLERFPNIQNEKRRTCAAMISAIDDGVGRMMELLKEKGVDDNTLIFLMSDNGAPANLSCGSVNDPLRGFKGSLLEGGIRVPTIVRWNKVIPKGKVCDIPVSSLDF